MNIVCKLSFNPTLALDVSYLQVMLWDLASQANFMDLLHGPHIWPQLHQQSQHTSASQHYLSVKLVFVFVSVLPARPRLFLLPTFFLKLQLLVETTDENIRC